MVIDIIGSPPVLRFPGRVFWYQYTLFGREKHCKLECLTQVTDIVIHLRAILVVIIIDSLLFNNTILTFVIPLRGNCNFN